MDSNNKKSRIQKLCDEIAEDLGNRKKYHAEQSVKYGYAHDTILFIGETMSQDPDDLSLDSNIEMLTDFGNVIKAMPEGGTTNFDVTSGTYTLASTVTATASSSIDRDFVSNFIESRAPSAPPAMGTNRTEMYAKKLGGLDPVLGEMYRSVWENFYGNIHATEHNALFAMRQTVDHFFSAIAPDEDVRNSPYFSPKEGPEDKKNDVHRGERVNYVAFTKIDNKENAKLLLSEENSLARHYRKLQKLHTRGELKKEETRQALIAMEQLLHQWIDAIDLS